MSSFLTSFLTCYLFSRLFSHLFSHAIFSHLFSRSRAIVIFICLCRKVQRMILRNIPKDNTRMSINFLPIFPFLSYFASPVRLPVIAKYYRAFPKSLFFDSNILSLTPGLPGEDTVLLQDACSQLQRHSDQPAMSVSSLLFTCMRTFGSREYGRSTSRRIANTILIF